MSLGGYDEARCRVMEHAALLWTLQEVPEPPAETSEDIHGTERLLSFEQERQLAEDFAFFASPTADANKVKAVCIEELPPSSLIVRVASNTQEKELGLGLCSIASAMRSAGEPGRSREKARNAMLIAIIKACRRRILTRLRSRHAQHLPKAKGKPPLSKLLLLSLNQPTRTAVPATLVHKCELIHQHCKQIDQTDEVDTMIERIKQLLEHVASVDVEELRDCLQGSTTLDPTLKTFLPDALTKLNRYTYAARNLVNIARMLSTAGLLDITVQAVTLTASNLDTITAQLRPFDKVTKDLRRAALSSATNKLLDIWQQKYTQGIASATWKVHAEIQLLVYYELNACQYPPRVIASNKSACYLCNKFIAIHGAYKTVRSHGRVYHRWTLPNLGFQDKAAAKRLTVSLLRLDEHLMRILNSGVARHKQHLPHPNESVTILRQPCPSLLTLPAPSSIAEVGHAIGQSQLSLHIMESRSDSCVGEQRLASNLTLALLTGVTTTWSLEHCMRFAVSTGLMHVEFEVSEDWLAEGQQLTLTVGITEPALILHSDSVSPAATMINVAQLDTLKDLQISFGGIFPAQIICIYQNIAAILTVNGTRTTLEESIL